MPRGAVQSWDPCITLLLCPCLLCPNLASQHLAQLYILLLWAHCIAWVFSAISPVHEHKLLGQIWAALVYEWDGSLANPQNPEQLKSSAGKGAHCARGNTNRYLQLCVLASHSMQSPAQTESWFNVCVIKLRSWVSGWFFWLLCQFDKIPVWAVLIPLSPVLGLGKGARGYTCLCSPQSAVGVTAAIWWHYWKFRNLPIAILSNLLWRTLLGQGGWVKWPPMVFSNPLWFCGISF